MRASVFSIGDDFLPANQPDGTQVCKEAIGRSFGSDESIARRARFAKRKT
jgi:hypothetical protein